MGQRASTEQAPELQRKKNSVDQTRYEVFELARPRHRRREPPTVVCPLEFCRKVLELVQGGDSNEVEFLLRDRQIQPTAEVKDHIASHHSESGLTSLHYAVRHEEVDLVKVLVEFCKDGHKAINAKTKEPDTLEFSPLHYAVRAGKLELVEALLSHPNIDLDVKDSDGSTPLHYACKYGYEDIILALRRGNFCLANNEDEYPLHLAATELHRDVFAAVKNDEELVEKLRNGQFASLKNSERNTLLHVVVDSEDMEAVKLCLLLGFDLRAGNIKGFNSLHVAARRGNVAIVNMLLDKERERGEEALHSFVNSRNRYLASSLYLAAKFGQVKVIKLLLKNGAIIEAPNSLEFTPLLAAIRYTNLKCVKALLAANANILTQDGKRQYNALLWAVEVQSQEILMVILNHVSKHPELTSIVWREKDPLNNTAHHIAAKARNLNILETLVERNAFCLEEKNKEGCTPFHVAVHEGKLGIVGYIVSKAASSVHSLDAKGNTGLHLAAECGHRDIVERLVTIHDFGTSVCTRNSQGHTPVHLAAKNGHQTVLKFLLVHSPKPTDTAEILDTDHATALYLACESGHTKCVQVLLEWNAMVTYKYHTRDVNKKKSCLEVAIDNDNSSVVTVIIQSNHWRQAMQFCNDPHCKEGGETPLRKLIKKMPVAAKLAFDRCVDERKIHDMETGSFIQQVHYNYELLEDFRDLFEDKGPNSYGISPGLAQLLRRNTAAATSDVFSTPLAFSLEAEPDENEPESPMELSQKEHTVPAHFQHHEPTAQACDQPRSWGPVKYQHENHPLHLMVHYKRLELLKHNLVASFIHYKWNLFGRYIYYPNIIIYILLMLMLTAYMYLRFDYSKALAAAICDSVSDCFPENDSFRFLNNCSFSDYNVTSQYIIDQLHRSKVGLIFCAVFIIINCLVRIGIELIQIVHHRGVYFTSYINYLEGFLYVGTIIFVSDFRLICLPSWQWQLGALCIFLSWINFILFLSEQPMVGIYVVMFQDIIKTFLRMAPMSILLILAFGQPFFMLLSTVVSPPPQQFVTFPYSLLKTIIMTVGEFETDPILFSTPSVVEYPVSTYLLWVIFIIIMPILLQNMLVGLAVDDIKSVQEKAALKKESLQIEFILDVMSQLPKPAIRYFNQREYTQTWGKGSIDKFRKWLSGEAWKPEIKSNNLETATSLKLEKLTVSMMTMEEKLHNLTEQVVKLERLMLHFAHEQERYLEAARQQLMLNRKRSTFRSQPSLTFQRRSHDEESSDGEV